jgi:hypothetical protein
MAKGKLSKARSKTTPNVPALMDKELAEAAQRSMARMKVPTQGNRVSIKGKQFSIGGRSIGDTLLVAIVDFGYGHAWYPGAYNEKNPQPPVCFALSMQPDDLVPHAIAPEKQHVDCATCPKNQFGSATTGSGRGKACKDLTRIVVMHEDELGSDESVAEGKIATLDLPAMSLKGWSEYSNAVVRKTNRELLAFVTKLTFESSVQYPVVQFELAETIQDPSVIMALKRRQDEAKELILSPWQPLSKEKRDDAAKAASTGRGGAQRGAGRSRFGK